MRKSPLVSLAATLLLLASCGGGGGSGGGGNTNSVITNPNPSGGGPGAGSTAADTTTNNARLADLNGLRAQCGGTALMTVSSLAPLITSAVKHAGYQAQYDVKYGGASLHHDEPDTALSLYVNTQFFVRIEAANGGADIANWRSYDEDIASQAGTPAMDSLWNTVYHRLPMMRTQVTSVGYGDQALARTDYPAAGIPATDPWGNVPAGNAYATLDFTGYANPAIALSFWPGNGTSGVLKAFDVTTESPRPPSGGLTTVGPPLHMVAPTLVDFSTIAVTLTTGGSAIHIPVQLIVGGANATLPTVSGDASAANTAVDTTDFNPGEIFILPLAAGNAGLAPSTTYSWTVNAVDSSSTHFNVGPVTFTTGP